MNNLRYEKISDSVISINLQNGYTVVAIEVFDHETYTYSVELYLKENSIDIWDKIDGIEPVTFNVNYKTIHSTVLKYIATLLSEGLFEKYIDRYEYMMKCFDKGNDCFEEESLK